MATIYSLPEGQISVSGGESISGITQGDGSHLVGETITLNSNAWETVEIVDNDSSFADNDGSQQLDGDQTYGGTSYTSGTRIEAEYTITVQDPDGNTYTIIGLNIREAGATNSYGTTEGLAFIGPIGGFPLVGVPLTVISASEGPSDGTTDYDDYATPPCFTAGTLINTADGPRAIEDLQVGDLVDTLDHGLQPVRWTGSASFSASDLTSHPELEPILIEKGALGSGLPTRDLIVSPQHRVLISDWRAELYYGEAEVLVAAKYLVNSGSIRSLTTKESVTYIHVLFDRHEVILSEGVFTESFQPGAEVCNGLSADVQAELIKVFPELKNNWQGFEAARSSIKSYQALPLAA